MKYYFLLLTFLISFITFSQPDTEVFLFDLNTENGLFELSNFKNISNNEGYDNQPSFLNNDIILYSGTRKDQTDIVKYNISYDSKIFINHTEGSEYSPLKIPNQKAVSSIRLEKDGTQKLYKYSLKNGESEVLIDDIIIGYHVWNSENSLASSVLEDNMLSLYVTDFKEGKNYKKDSNIGRSLHNIPNTKLISYISKATEPWEIKSLNPTTSEIKSIMATLPKTEDMCWLPNGSILIVYESILYTFTPKKDVDWIEVGSLEEFGIHNITRLTVSPNGKKLAIVGELENPNGKIIEGPLSPQLKNIEWISGNWKGEAFGGETEENWSKPSGGSMMAAFKLIKDGEVVFYEIEIIKEVENSLILQLKHFNNDLKGWETKDETVDFPLKEITSDKVVFEGMTFEKINEKEMNVYVDMHKKDGSVETLKFNYTKD